VQGIGLGLRVEGLRADQRHRQKAAEQERRSRCRARERGRGGLDRFPPRMITYNTILGATAAQRRVRPKPNALLHPAPCTMHPLPEVT